MANDTSNNPLPMRSVTDAKAKVLFVDDDTAFLQLVDQAFTTLSSGAWEIHLAENAEKARRILREHTINVAVLDIQMPGVGGLELLKVLDRDYPGLQKVLLTGISDQQTRLSGLESGAELFLEKPANLAGLESVYATLNELIRWQQKQDARGQTRPARLLDIIRMECSSGNSRIFEVSGEARGQIYIREGAIVHAQGDGRRGQSAFTHLASQLSPEFNLKQFVDPPERSIDRQWEFLVMEAFRTHEQLLEAAAEAKAKAEAQAGAPTAGRPPSGGDTTQIIKRLEEPSLPLRRATAAPLAPGPTPPSATPPPAPTTVAPPPAPAAIPMLAMAPARNLVPPPAEPSAEVVESDEVEPVVIQAAPATLPVHPIAEAAGFKIEEMLLCSKQREVLYEWQCSQTDSRVKLIEHVARHFHHTNHGMPIGGFDRLESQANNARVVIRFQDDNGLLIRSSTTGRPRGEAAAKSDQSTIEWLSRSMDASGVLACGVVRPDLIPTSMAFSTDIPVDRLNAFWIETAELFEVISDRRFPAWQLRLVFELAQFYCVRRADRFAFGLMLTKDPGILDVAAAESLLGQVDEFRGV